MVERVGLVEDPPSATKAICEKPNTPGRTHTLVVGLAVVAHERRWSPAAGRPGHVALEDVPELRQLVELEAGEDGADAREAIVVVEASGGISAAHDGASCGT